MYPPICIYLSIKVDRERQLDGIPEGHVGVGPIEKNKADEEDKVS